MNTQAAPLKQASAWVGQPKRDRLKIIQPDLSVAHAIGQVVANSWRYPGPGIALLSLALFTKDKTPQLIAQMLNLLRISGVPEALGKHTERLLFVLAGFNSLADKFSQNSVLTEAMLPSEFAR